MLSWLVAQIPLYSNHKKILILDPHRHLKLRGSEHILICKVGMSDTIHSYSIQGGLNQVWAGPIAGMNIGGPCPIADD